MKIFKNTDEKNGDLEKNLNMKLEDVLNSFKKHLCPNNMVI